MDEPGILHHIRTLVERERALRGTSGTDALQPGPAGPTELDALETELDQCWDLLRQRRARREFGGDTGEAQVRGSSVVEHYLQ